MISLLNLLTTDYLFKNLSLEGLVDSRENIMHHYSIVTLYFLKYQLIKQKRTRLARF